MGSAPNWFFNYVPSPAEWVTAFAGKQDDLGLSTATINALAAGINAPGGFTQFNIIGITAALGYTPLNPANNLSDVASLATTYTNLGAGANNGIATLDSIGDLPVGQLTQQAIGCWQYQGTWNAFTNLPTILSGDPGVGRTRGAHYKVSVAGTTTVDGNSLWNIGDYIAWDGVSWDRILGPNSALVGNVQSFSSPGANTWTKPSSGTMVLVECWGGGQSGNVGAGTSVGGQGGQYVRYFFPIGTFGTTVTVTVGAGGVVSTTASFNSGINTTFGAFLTAYGGGVANNVGSGAGAAGATSATNANVWAVEPGAGGGYGVTQAPGTSQFGGNGGAGVTSGAAGAGSPGGGGGGSVNNAAGTSGAGGNGKCKVTVF